MAVFWVVVPCSLVKFTRVSEILPASIKRPMIFVALMMEARWRRDRVGTSLQEAPLKRW
jgi:hypothetical protein